MKYFLLGAVIGDVVGSTKEWKTDISPEFKFITKANRFTDDTILTLAVSEALLKNRPFDMMIQKYARKYPRMGYGGMFTKWANTAGDRAAYNSYGNGSAMRGLSIPLFYNDLPTVLRQAVKQSSCTHNHTDSLDAVMQLAHVTFMARTCKDKSELYKMLKSTYGYEYKKPGDVDTRKNSLHSITGVHEAFNCFFTGNDFTEVLRESIMHGGDTDTLAAIACGLAYVFYEKLPNELAERVLRIIPEEFRKIIKEFAKITEGKKLVEKSVTLF
ncbi:MAG: ADP-ribosylglycohydrolase family protein [Candidatus Pacearchaeota archaeon]|jgi:ADP-ribosylglycohydrolase